MAVNGSVYRVGALLAASVGAMIARAFDSTELIGEIVGLAAVAGIAWLALRK